MATIPNFNEFERHLEELAQLLSAENFKTQHPDYDPTPDNYAKLEDARRRYGYPFSADGLRFSWQRVKDEELVGRVTDPWQMSQVQMLAEQARLQAQRLKYEEEVIRQMRDQVIKDWKSPGFFGVSQAKQQAQNFPDPLVGLDQILNDLLKFSGPPKPPDDWQRQEHRAYEENLAKSTTLTFGKYKGIELRDVPADYLSWLVDTAEADAKRYRDELARRDAVEHSSMDLITRLLTVGYKELAKKAHPDGGGSQEQFVALQGAFETLKIAAEAIKETKCTT